MAERADGRTRGLDEAQRPEAGRAGPSWVVAALALVIGGVVLWVLAAVTDGPGWLFWAGFTSIVASCTIVAALVLLDARRRQQNPVLAVGRAVWAAIRWYFRMVP